MNAPAMRIAFNGVREAAEAMVFALITSAKHSHPANCKAMPSLGAR
jgi:hypothetical protein